MKQIPFFIFLLVVGIFSCTDDYQLSTLQDSRILVVNGCITNEQGPYRIYLFEDISNLSSNSSNVISQPVTDARLFITDDLGNRDELKPLWKERVEEVKKLIYYDEDSYPHYSVSEWLLVPNYSGGYDSIRLDSYFNTIEKYVGTYYTTSIVGIPGRTYTLSVDYAGNIYTAVDRMPSSTKIDSITLKPVGIGVENKDMDGFYVPFLNFAEPQDETNYYFFTAAWVDSVENGSKMELPAPQKFTDLIVLNRYSQGYAWWCSVISDRFMAPYMANYKVDDGPSSRSWFSGTDSGWKFYHSNYHLDIYMLSISNEAYRYYQALTEQFYQDGGAFSPAPASPPTNVSNGGQGFFMATSVSTCRSKRMDKNSQ